MILGLRLIVLPAHQLDSGGTVCGLNGVKDMVVPLEGHLLDLAYILAGVDEQLIEPWRQHAPVGGGLVLDLGTPNVFIGSSNLF